MRRYYYLCDDLDELESIEQELEQDGFTHHSIHILSRDDAGVEQHHLHNVPSLLRFDTLDYAGRGLLVGLALSATLLLTVWLSGLLAQIGTGPFILLALLITLFCSWEGGFLGFQTLNHRLKRFMPALKRGQHLLLIDIPDTRLRQLQQHMMAHPRLKPAGAEDGFTNPFT